jgi:hypothetical protein
MCFLLFFYQPNLICKGSDIFMVRLHWNVHKYSPNTSYSLLFQYFFLDMCTIPYTGPCPCMCLHWATHKFVAYREQDLNLRNILNAGFEWLALLVFMGESRVRISAQSSSFRTEGFVIFFSSSKLFLSWYR